MRPVFIIARFRSGSTILWQLFDALGDRYIAFYEPMHDEIRAHMLKKSQGGRLNHKIVRPNPFYLYNKLSEDILKLHKPAFAYKKLYLSRYDRYPELYRWIKSLIDYAYSLGRIPVFQFNRADFRVAWLRHKFPNARIIYLVRNPRNQYISFIKTAGMSVPDGQTDPPVEWLTDAYIPYREFGWHLFFLRQWRVLLSYQFPFLITRRFKTSYELSYCIWKLSLLLNSKFAELIIDYEGDFGSGVVLEKLVERGFMNEEDARKLRPLLRPAPPDRWREFAPEEWFSEQEERCDRLSKILGLVPWYGRIPLWTIKMMYAPAWLLNGGIAGDSRYVRFFEEYFIRTTGRYLEHIKKILRDM